jgi:hypothetical protein
LPAPVRRATPTDAGAGIGADLPVIDHEQKEPETRLIPRLPVDLPVLEDEFASTPLEDLPVRGDSWRIEVVDTGKYWQWRKRGSDRRYMYGGKFESLSIERQAAYYENRKSKSRSQSHRRTRGVA